MHAEMGGQASEKSRKIAVAEEVVEERTLRQQVFVSSNARNTKTLRTDAVAHVTSDTSKTPATASGRSVKVAEMLFSRAWRQVKQGAGMLHLRELQVLR